MNILKKLGGIIILLFTILLCFPAAYVYPIQFENCRKKFEEGAIGAPGSAIAFFICFIPYVLITYFLIKLSLKLIRKKKTDSTSIEEIGKE